MSAERPRRILLLAYEFPPSPSPQSLRWVYFARELALLGNEVHVLAPRLPRQSGGLPELPDSVKVHRCFAGPVMGLLAWRDRRRVEALQGTAGADGADGDGNPGHSSGDRAPTPPEELNWKGRLWHAGLNWKGRLFYGFQSLLGWLLFPDQRGEWRPWARRRLVGLLAEIRPDVVISSHEPATTLELGLLARRAGFPWIVDIGDPVLAPYTPRRWRRRSLRLEREACRGAGHVIVTTQKAAELLASRHDLPPGRISVLTQGFDHRYKAPVPAPAGPFADDRLELLYTGSFYGFRRHQPLLRAVLATPGVRLNIASIRVPPDVEQASQAAPGSVRLLGFLPHLQALALQRRADVLVNLANDDPCQVPGKLYEYLGAGRPILHVGGGEADVVSQLLQRTGHGQDCPNDADAIARVLAALAAARPAPSFPVDERTLPHAWATSAARLDAIIRGLLADAAPPGP